jgi:hypothetical protein
MLALLLLISVNPDMGKDYQKVAEDAAWTWSNEKASLAYCLKNQLRGYKYETTDPTKQDPFMKILVRNGEVVSPFKAHGDTVFVCSDEKLYVADFPPISSGCAVIALDLKTGKQLWKAQLTGLPRRGHSKYSNRVNIESDGKAITVWGNELGGQYVEILDAKTGKIVGHKVFRENK